MEAQTGPERGRGLHRVTQDWDQSLPPEALSHPVVPGEVLEVRPGSVAVSNRVFLSI